MRNTIRVVAAWTILLAGLSVAMAQQGVAASRPVAPVAQAAAGSSDWNQYRGPQRNGASMGTDWKLWQGDNAKILWKANVKTGYSTISVVNGRAFTSGNKDDVDTVVCLDADTGKSLWTYDYPCKTVAGPLWPGTRATPLVVDGLLFTLSREGEVFCLDANSGKMLWSKKLSEELGVKPPKWGYAGSALPLGDLVVFDVGPIVALEKASGKIAWKSEIFQPSYASPVPITVGEKKCLASINAEGPVVVEIGSGKTICKDAWRTQYDINACDPIVLGEKFFITSGYDHGCALYDAANGKQLYTNKDLADQFSTPVLKDGYLYGWHGNVGGETLKCVELATGAVKWSGPKYKVGSVVLSGDRLITLGDGTLVIAQASPDGYKELAKVKVLDGETWTMPVLDHGRIYCRNTAGDLVVVDVSGK